jgi:D-alanyl-D-alanine carboxypeptidase/D-alanyl-D-alanine-endopeptidase (penicillin-binding protein 4)
LLIEGSFIRKTGIDPASLSIVDGEGSSDNRVSPEAAVVLLTAMAAGPYNEVYREAMPVLGVDGSLANAAAPDNPATGHLHAKTGTSMQADMNGDVMLLAKGLAGYMTTKSGRDVAFALYANNIRISDFDELAEVNTDMASIPGAFFEAL